MHLKSLKLRNQFSLVCQGLGLVVNG